MIAHRMRDAGNVLKIIETAFAHGGLPARISADHFLRSQPFLGEEHTGFYILDFCPRCNPAVCDIDHRLKSLPAFFDDDKGTPWDAISWLPFEHRRFVWFFKRDQRIAAVCIDMPCYF